MSEQLDLFGFHPPSRDERLYFALVPSDPVKQQIFRLARGWRSDLGLTGPPISPGCLHVSLHGLGDYAGIPRRLVEVTRKAGHAVRQPAFDITFDRVLSFNGKNGKRPFVLRPSTNIAALSEFHRALGSSMNSVGLARCAVPRFTPHMTLLYDRQRVPERTVEAVCWHVDGFVLIHSLLNRGRHVHLARWPLNG
jgi:2'-5' RNA ligase